jgi:hypothetical protein
MTLDIQRAGLYMSPTQLTQSNTLWPLKQVLLSGTSRGGEMKRDGKKDTGTVPGVKYQWTIHKESLRITPRI